MAKGEFLNHLVWGWKWRLHHFTNFPGFRESANSHCGLMKWVTLKVREPMTGEFARDVCRHTDQGKNGSQKAWTSLNPCRKIGFVLGSLLSSHVISLSAHHPGHAVCRGVWDPSDLTSLVCMFDDRPEPLLSSQLLRLENLVLLSFFSQLYINTVVFKAQWTQLPPAICQRNLLGERCKSLKLPRVIETLFPTNLLRANL